MTTPAARAYPVAHPYESSEKVKFLLDMCDRDPMWNARVVAKIRGRIPDLVSRGLVSVATPPGTISAKVQPPAATMASTAKVHETQKYQKPIIPLQLVIPDQMNAPPAQPASVEQEGSCQADGQKISIIFSNLPVQWDVSAVICALRQADIAGITGVQVVKPGSAIVQIRSSQLATRCLALHGSLLPHLTGFFPVVVELLSESSFNAAGVWTEPVKIRTRAQVPAFGPPPGLASPCDDARPSDRATGPRRKAARSTSRGPVKDVAKVDNDDVQAFSMAAQAHENLLTMLLQNDMLAPEITDVVAQNFLKKWLSSLSGDAL